MRRLIALTSFITLLSSPASADLIENGGFERPALDDSTWALFDNIPGWSVVDGGKIEIQNNVAGSPYEGEQFVELDSTRPSTIFQDVETVVGQLYQLSFAFSARPGTDIRADNVMSVVWGDSEVFNMAAPGYTPDWTVFTLHVTADSELTRLSFGDLSLNRRNSYGVYLDDVRLVAKVPEPGTLALLGLGLFGTGFARRFRGR